MENEHVSDNQLNDWEQVQSPFSTIKAHLIDIDDNNSAIIKDGFFSAFPPGNHEDLPITITQEEMTNTNNNIEPFKEPKPTRFSFVDGMRKWKRLELGFFRTGVLRIGGRIRKYAGFKAGFLSFAMASSVVLLCLLRKSVRKWWQRQMEMVASKERLMLLIQEKDKKINQLLLQIAKLDEMLLARRRVPVIRVIKDSGTYFRSL